MGFTEKDIIRMVKLKNKGYTNTEIGDKLGIPTGTVNNRIFRLRKSGEWENYGGLTKRKKGSKKTGRKNYPRRTAAAAVTPTTTTGPLVAFVGNPAEVGAAIQKTLFEGINQ